MEIKESERFFLLRLFLWAVLIVEYKESSSKTVKGWLGCSNEGERDCAD